MKYVLLLILLTGCSFIKIQESPQPEKHRSQILTLTAYTCYGESALCKEDSVIRISRDKIIYYYSGISSDTCQVRLLGTEKDPLLKMSCSELDGVLNQ